jgi:endonuclease/exonuclease/phosphatase family metal-dependent hydrolase
LPPPASFANKRPNPDYRAVRIAEEVAKYDVIALQETFHEKHRGQILDGVQQAWNAKPNVMIAPQPEGFATNGGCLLATRLPMPVVNSVVFKHFSKPAEYGLRADGFAAKGVIQGQIVPDEKHPDETIDVYVTHLEARAGQLRPKQYVELAEFIKQTSDPKRPLILVGDLNTNGLKEDRSDPESQYSQLMKTLNGARPSGMIDVWVALRGDQHGGTSEQESIEIGKRIDYILISNPDHPGTRLVPKSIEVNTYLDEKVIALSDHNAVVAEFEWSRSNP